MSELSCKCGGYSVTTAALAQMSPEQRAQARLRISNCPTCRKDRELRK